MTASAKRTGPKPVPRPRRISQTRDALVLQHTSLVRSTAFQLLRRMPAHIELDDLVQAGMVGLLEAANRFNTDQGSEFHSYAAVRVRGAMLDFVRQSDWGPRWLPRRRRAIDDAKRRLYNEGSKNVTAARIASALGVSLEIYHRTVQQVSRAQHARLDELNSSDLQPSCEMGTDGGVDPADQLDREHLHRILALAIDALPEKERLIVLIPPGASLSHQHQPISGSQGSFFELLET